MVRRLERLADIVAGADKDVGAVQKGILQLFHDAEPIATIAIQVTVGATVLSTQRALMLMITPIAIVIVFILVAGRRTHPTSMDRRRTRFDPTNPFAEGFCRRRRFSVAIRRRWDTIIKGYVRITVVSIKMVWVRVTEIHHRCNGAAITLWKRNELFNLEYCVWKGGH